MKGCLLLGLISFVCSSRAASLRVAGSPGYRQSAKFEFVRCEVDGSGFPRRFGCESYVRQRPLNLTIRLEPGFYIFRYEHSLYAQNIRADDRVLIELQKAENSRDFRHTLWANEGTYAVLRNSESAEERAKTLALRWGNANEAERVERLCRSGQPQDRDECAAWMGNGPAALNWMLMGDTGGMSWIDASGEFPAPRPLVVSEAVPYGEFISVFPGNYIIVDAFMDERSEVKLSPARPSARRDDQSPLGPLPFRPKAPLAF